MNEIELRDTFAMHAMTMFLNGTAFTGHDYEYIARSSYQLADAMLKAREEWLKLKVMADKVGLGGRK